MFVLTVALPVARNEVAVQAGDAVTRSPLKTVNLPATTILPSPEVDGSDFIAAPAPEPAVGSNVASRLPSY